MSKNADIAAIKLLERTYHVKCPPEQIADLQKAAHYLDTKMREFLKVDKIISSDDILMIAALNITNDLIEIKKQKNDYMNMMNEKILDIQTKINQALAQ